MKLRPKDTFEAVLSDKGSIKILDEYIKSKKQYFLINTCFNIIHIDKIYEINFIISNKIPVDKKIIATNITMTEFKKIYGYGYCDCNSLINYRKRLSSENRCFGFSWIILYSFSGKFGKAKIRRWNYPF